MRLIVLRGGRPEPAIGAAGDNARPPARDPAATGQRGAVALSDDGLQWVLLNVAPNVVDQLAADPALARHAGLRAGAVRSLILTDAQVDHVAGLLSLRDGPPIQLYATPAVFELLSQAMPVLQVLQQYCGVQWHVIPIAGETLSAQFRVEGLPGLEFTALATESLMPPCLVEPELNYTTGLSVALAVREGHSGRRLFWSPSGQTLSTTELDWMRDADCVMVDAQTTWPPEAPPATWRARRKVVLARPAEAREPTNAHDFEPAYDGMVIDL